MGVCLLAPTAYQLDEGATAHCLSSTAPNFWCRLCLVLRLSSFHLNRIKLLWPVIPLDFYQMLYHEDILYWRHCFKGRLSFTKVVTWRTRIQCFCNKAHAYHVPRIILVFLCGVEENLGLLRHKGLDGIAIFAVPIATPLFITYNATQSIIQWHKESMWLLSAIQTWTRDNSVFKHCNPWWSLERSGISSINVPLCFFPAAALLAIDYVVQTMWNLKIA